MAYGPDAIDELVQEAGLSYPVTARQIERDHALANIDVDDSGLSIMVGEVLARTDADRFESREDLVEKLAPVFERERAERRTGVLGKVKEAFLGRR